MIPAPPPALVAEAPSPAPAALLLEAFAAARRSARAAADPASVLAGRGPVADKLAAIDALHARIPNVALRRRVAALNAIADAAASAQQPAEVRARALAVLGYAMPQVDDDAARTRGLGVLLGALRAPADRIFALRGLGPASHGLPRSDEAAYQGALLDLLDGPVAGEERAVALVDLYAFVSTRDDLAQRAPALVERLDARLLGPIEADPAAFARDPRGTPASRTIAAATFWVSARQRQSRGDPAPAARAHAVLAALAAVEPDGGARRWLETYRDAAPALAASTTRRGPPGPDAP